MWATPTLRTKRIILQMNDVKYLKQEIADDINTSAVVIRYPKSPGGIHQASQEFQDALRKLLGDAISR